VVAEELRGGSNRHALLGAHRGGGLATDTPTQRCNHALANQNQTDATSQGQPNERPMHTLPWAPGSGSFLFLSKHMYMG